MLSILRVWQGHTHLHVVPSVVWAALTLATILVHAEPFTGKVVGISQWRRSHSGYCGQPFEKLRKYEVFSIRPSLYRIVIIIVNCPQPVWSRANLVSGSVRT